MTTLSGIEIGGRPAAAVTGQVGVPLLIGRTQDEAVAALRGLGLREVVQFVETLGTEGTVYGQVPLPPAVRPRNAPVVIQVIKAPVTPPDLGKRLDEIAAAVAAVETEAAAAGRQQELLDRLDDIEGKLTPSPTGAGRPAARRRRAAAATAAATP